MDKKKNAVTPQAKWKAFLPYAAIIAISFLIAFLVPIFQYALIDPYAPYNWFIDYDLIGFLEYYYPFIFLGILLSVILLSIRKTSLMKNYPFLVLAFLNILFIEYVLFFFYLPHVYIWLYPIMLNGICDGMISGEPKIYYPLVNLCTVSGYPFSYPQDILYNVYRTFGLL